MKKVCFVLLGVAFTQIGFSQKEMRVTSEWAVSRRKFISGDTLTFTLTISRHDRNRYYTDPAWYKLYQVENGKKVPIEDTSKKGGGVAIHLGKKDRVVVKKLVTQPGIYFLRYPLLPVTDGPARTVFAEQKFTVSMRDKGDGEKDRFDN